MTYRSICESSTHSHKDAGHGGIFQYHDEFVATALEFLDR